MIPTSYHFSKTKFRLFGDTNLRIGDKPIYGDAFICALGYESRSRYVAETLEINAPIKLAVCFDYNPVLARDVNEKSLAQLGFETIPLEIEAVFAHLEPLAEIPDDVARIVIDISSMSKEMMAICLSAIGRLAQKRPVTLTSLYAPTSYYPPRSPFPVERQGPVIPALGGWATAPENPLAAIVGLGNEIGLAVGAIQAIEPSLLWTYSGCGIDTRFDNDVKIANEDLDKVYHLTEFQYDLNDPTSLRHDLHSRVISLLPSHRVVIIPMGPKLFSHMAIMIALFERQPDLAVWQFSSGSRAVAEDRLAEGPIIGHAVNIEIDEPV